MSNRFALIIASYQYQDADLRQLVAPAQDAEALARVLGDPSIGDFEVRTLLNEPSYKVNQAIEAFFADRKRDDLLLLYFSGHGIKDEDGQLYFATANTRRERLLSTALPANFVNAVMRRSRSRRQVLLLDCCYSGAFARGMVAKADKDIGSGERFEGRGRVVLTASDAMQYAFEGDEITGEGVRSTFTRTLVHGLETGEADLDGDGLVSLDELYGYVHDRVTEKTPHQRPGKWDFEVQGEIVIARNPRPVVKPTQLPMELRRAIESPFAGLREGTVQELDRLLRGSDPGLALAAHGALTHLADDDSRRVSAAAARSLAAYAGAKRSDKELVGAEQRIPAREGEQQKKKRRASEKPEQERRSWWERLTQHCGRLLQSQIGPWPAWGWVLGGMVVVALLAGLLSQGWGLWPGVGPTATPTKTPTVEPTATATTMPASVPDTPQPTDTPTPTPAPTATSTPTLTPTAEPTLAAVDTLTRPVDGMVMVYVPAGEFEMGDSPVRTVTLDDYWIDRTEVTNAQFAAFLNDRGNQAEGGATWLELNDEGCPIEWSGGEFRPKSGYADHPVAEVTWYGARAYCEWVGARLPTEEEWEKAARGTDGREYPWGDWEEGRCNTQEAGVGRTTPVGQYSPGGDSPYGCADMAGNVWEWTSSLWKSTRRVSRGGSWGKDRSEARCAASDWDYPSYSITDYGGFRCVSPVP